MFLYSTFIGRPLWICRPIGAGSAYFSLVYRETCSPLSQTVNVSPFASTRMRFQSLGLSSSPALVARASSGYVPV